MPKPIDAFRTTASDIAKALADANPLGKAASDKAASDVAKFAEPIGGRRAFDKQAAAIAEILNGDTAAPLTDYSRSSGQTRSKWPASPAEISAARVFQSKASASSVPSVQGTFVALQTPISSVAELGMLVRKARTRLGFSQQRFGDLAGVGRRFVSELEAGKKTLEIDRVLRCCAAAGIDLFARSRDGR